MQSNRTVFSPHDPIVVHSYFNEDHIERDASSREYTRQMRLNFAAFLYRRMCHPASVSFAPRQVMIYSRTDSFVYSKRLRDASPADRKDLQWATTASSSRQQFSH